MSIIKIRLNYCARCNCKICDQSDYKKEIYFVDKINEHERHHELHYEMNLTKDIDVSKLCECEKPMSTLLFISYMGLGVQEMKDCIVNYWYYKHNTSYIYLSHSKEKDNNNTNEKLKKFISSGIEYKVNCLSIKFDGRYYKDESYIKHYICNIERFENCNIQKLDYLSLGCHNKNISYVFIEEDKLPLEDYKNFPPLVYVEAYMLFDISDFEKAFTDINGFNDRFKFSLTDTEVMNKIFNILKSHFVNSIEEFNLTN